MVGFYGSKFADLWKGCDLANVKTVWADELAGYSADEIKRGIDGCRTRPFPPTLPEFLLLCRPHLNYDAAFAEAAEQLRRRESGNDQWSNPAIYWSAVKIGSHDMHSSRYDQLRGRWQKALDDAIANIKAGKLPNEVPQRMTALPSPGQTTPPTEEVKKRIDSVLSKLTGR